MAIAIMRSALHRDVSVADRDVLKRRLPARRILRSSYQSDITFDRWPERPDTQDRSNPMQALKDNTAPELVADRTDPPARNLVSIWAQGRRRITPWAYQHMRALGAVRLAVGAFLVVLGTLLATHGQPGWAAIPLAGAVLNLAIGGMDTTAAFNASRRS
jgi:hypothetical protein